MLIKKLCVFRLTLQGENLKAEYFMRPVLSDLMTVTMFRQQLLRIPPKPPVIPVLKLLTSCPRNGWRLDSPVMKSSLGYCRHFLILIKSHFKKKRKKKKRWPQTSHFSHLRSNSSFPIARGWSPELAKLRSRIGDVYQISPLIWCAGLD